MGSVLNSTHQQFARSTLAPKPKRLHELPAANGHMPRLPVLAILLGSKTTIKIDTNVEMRPQHSSATKSSAGVRSGSSLSSVITLAPTASNGSLRCCSSVTSTFRPTTDRLRDHDHYHTVPKYMDRFYRNIQSKRFLC